MSEEIQFSQEKNIGLITLNRVQALNAITLAMVKELQSQLITWEADDSIHAIVIQAAPGKAFCAGGDVRWLYETGLKKDKQQTDFFWHEYRLNHYIHHLKKPYIALMNGITMGGGVGISLHGSHPVAGEQFVFAMPETGIGFFPDIGASHLLSHMPDAFGMYYGLTGHRVGAHDALKLGLIKQVIKVEQFDAFISHLVESDLSTDAYHRVDTCLKQFSVTCEQASIDNIRVAVANAFHQENVETIFSILEKNQDNWSQETLSILKQKAPLSLKITFEQLKRAASMDLKNCLIMDFCLVRHFMQAHDFYEGVRALLVDKDKNPQWQQRSLSEVTAANVANYFESEQPPLTFIS